MNYGAWLNITFYIGLAIKGGNMNIIETADKFGITKEAVYKWIKNGRIKPEIREGHYYFPPDVERPAKRTPGPKAGK